MVVVGGQGPFPCLLSLVFPAMELGCGWGENLLTSHHQCPGLSSAPTQPDWSESEAPFAPRTVATLAVAGVGSGKERGVVHGSEHGGEGKGNSYILQDLKSMNAASAPWTERVAEGLGWEGSVTAALYPFWICPCSCIYSGHVYPSILPCPAVVPLVFWPATF